MHTDPRIVSLQRLERTLAQYLRMQKIIDDMKRRYCGTDQEKK